MTLCRCICLCCALIAAALSCPAAPNAAASPPAPSLPQAFARLRANDAAGAAQIAQAVTVQEPNNARAWRLLGVASLALKDYDGSLSAFMKSLEIEPNTPSALYNIGVASALKGDKDAAFAWLGKAKATRKLDMTMMQTDTDLVSLRSDPRYAALLPTPADFLHPFVEPVKVLREWDGEAAGDQFGWIARPIGDVDGDGIPDLVTSAPTKAVGGANAGRVYVYSTRTGRRLWTVDGKPGDQLGTGIEAAGDTNGDGIPDVIAGAPGAGKAYLLSGKDGHILHTLTAEDKGDAFGQHVSGVGGVNGDGRSDVIVGAPSNNAGGKGAGRAYVYSGRDGHRLLTLTGARAGDGFGSTVAGYADKRRFFLIVGAPGAGLNKTGRTYIYDHLTQTPLLCDGLGCDGQCTRRDVCIRSGRC